MPAGRPSKYDFNLCKEICDRVANGENIIAVLESDEKFPVWSTFRLWKNDNEELSTLYVKAQQDKSEAMLHEMDKIWEGCRLGSYDASVANVLIQTLKWKASKFYPKMYGDKTQTEHSGTIESKQADLSNLTYEQLIELKRTDK